MPSRLDDSVVFGQRRRRGMDAGLLTLCRLFCITKKIADVSVIETAKAAQLFFCNNLLDALCFGLKY
jgi:hypothetical protein